MGEFIDGEEVAGGDTLEVQPDGFEQIPHWVLFHERATANGVRLYLVLRSYAMGRGVAFPSRRTLADAMQVSMPTMDAAKRCLLEIGAITVTGRSHPDGNKRSNLYTLRWSDPKSEGGSKETCTTPSKESFLGWQRNLGIEAHLLEADLLEADKREIMQKPVTPLSDMLEEFERFWSVYPRKEGRAKARLAWGKARRTATEQDIITGAVRYRDDPNREPAFTAHASTWLNGERWLDEPLPGKATRNDRKQAEVSDMIQRAMERDRAREMKGIGQ